MNAGQRVRGRPAGVPWLRAGLLAILLGAAWAGPALAGPGAPPPPDVTDENVNRAIERAGAWIKAQRGEGGHWEGEARDTQNVHWGGSTGLAVLSLLYAGEDPQGEWLRDSLEWLAEQTLNGTYTYGTRAHVLALLPGRMYTSRLEADLEWLLTAVWSDKSDHPGCYDYIAHTGTAGRWDNSVTQFGVLGVWMAAEAGLTVPPTYWEMVAQHWLKYQNTDGGWGYQQHAPSTGSMTAAGLTSLFVALDYRYADQSGAGAGVVSAIERGLNWLGREYTPDNPHGEDRWRYYYLYGVERAGRASGHKYFRSKDWFRDGAEYLLAAQKESGAWPATGSECSELRNTAFGLMFLSHGRAPLLFNKLQHGPEWNRKMRDVAGLTRYVGHTFERLMNWQVVRLDGNPADLTDAPVLYMYGESEWEFSDNEVQMLRDYCLRGGLLFAVAGKDGAGFRRGFESLARRAFPEHLAHELPNDHPLFNGDVSFKLLDPPAVLAVDNGLRMLMLLSTRDLAESWNRYAVRGKTLPDFYLGANVYLYATDKTTPRSRLETPEIPLRRRPVERTISVARIKHSGRWDVEPYGWTRLRTYLQNETGTNLLVSSGIRLDDQALQEFPVAHLTGLGALALSVDEVRGLRRYLSSGGTLLADAAGGSREFVTSLEGYLREALQSEPTTLRPDSFLMTGRGIPGAADLGGIEYRRTARGLADARKYPRINGFGSSRRLVALYSPLDLSTGLLGTQVFGMPGYAPESCLRIMRNLVLYAGLTTTEKARLHAGSE